MSPEGVEALRVRILARAAELTADGVEICCSYIARTPARACILGMCLEEWESTSDYRNKAARILGITLDQARSLECGFMGWDPHAFLSLEELGRLDFEMLGLGVEMARALVTERP